MSLRLKKLPTFEKSGRKIFGLVCRPSLHHFSREKLDCADLFARKSEWSIVFSPIAHNEFLTGFFRRRQLANAIQPRACSKFFHQFARGRLVIAFVSFDVTGCA